MKIILLQALMLLAAVCFTQPVYAPLPNYLPAARGCQAQGRDALITAYFKQSFTNKEICAVLVSAHGIFLSASGLKKILRRLQCKRKVPVTDGVLYSAIEQIQKELSTSGSSLGYRAMWHRLRLNGIQVPRDKVRMALLRMDPDAVRRRGLRRLKRRNYVNPGPDFVWHVDGYDKNKALRVCYTWRDRRFFKKGIMAECWSLK